MTAIWDFSFREILERYSLNSEKDILRHNKRTNQSVWPKMRSNFFFIKSLNKTISDYFFIWLSSEGATEREKPICLDKISENNFFSEKCQQMFEKFSRKFFEWFWNESIFDDFFVWLSSEGVTELEEPICLGKTSENKKKSERRYTPKMFVCLKNLIEIFLDEIFK